MPRVKLFDEKQVLEKAMELFWKKGYNATSIQDLVNHLGINRASLYDTYGGKRPLFDRAFAHYRQTNTVRITNFLEQEKDIREGLRKFFSMVGQQTVSDCDKKGCFVVNTTTELIPGDQDISDVLQKNKSAFVEMFHNFLLKGEREGQIAKGKELKTIADLLFTYYNGLQVVSKIDPDPEKISNAVDQLLALLE